MAIRHLFCFIAALLFAAVAHITAIDWPVAPFNQSHPIGNSYGEFQFYGGSPYFHPGIDLMAPPGTPVYAVKAGYVKAVLTISADLHWRVAIGDSAGAAECDGWLYAHLDPYTIAVSEGEHVDKGQYLGDLVTWTVADFHHLHFVKIRNSGVVWDSDWQFIANPLDELEVLDDPDAPVIVDALSMQKFAFLRNETADYFGVGEPVDGDIDIVCKAYDYFNDYRWPLAPHRLEYMISGDSSIPWTNSVCFTGELDYSHNVEVVYQVHGLLESQGNYDAREYYFNVTNTDGDSVIEETDRPYSWSTSNFRNGRYTIYVRAYDRAGNSTIDSMEVMVANFFALSGSILPADGDPDLSGTVVTAWPSEVSGTTDASGYFEIIEVGGGWRDILVSRPGYETVDTIIMMNQNRTLDLELAPSYIAGDANYDGDVNIADVVYLINYIFHDGWGPIPYLAGDANSDDNVNIGDAVYLASYIFGDGPSPLVTLETERLREFVNVDGGNIDDKMSDYDRP